MAQTREIKKRMTAVGTIQRITKTMQMIATAKFTAAVGRTKATRPYTDRISELVAEVTAAAGEVEHPLIDGPPEPAGRELVFVITSDRGLCGAYNAHVLRTTNAHLKSLREQGSEFVLETSGKKAVGFFRFQRTPITKRHTFGDRPAFDEIERLAGRFIEEFREGRYDAVRVAYMRYYSNARQRPEILQLLPSKPAEPALLAAGPGGASTGGPAESTDIAPRPSTAVAYDFSPSALDLLDDLLPMAIKTTLFQAFNDAVVSEQIMRMVAMKAATENAKELGKTLRRDFNRARQSQITTELTEIISGATALE